MKSLYIVFPKKRKVDLQEEVITDPGSGEVICAASKSSISIGTETYCLLGEFDPGTNWDAWVNYPFRPGYGMSATIVAVGKDVLSLQEGDRIAASVAHQQFFKIQERDAHKIPEGISDDDASWMSLACTAQLGVRRAELKLGEDVGVVGLGILGQLVVQYARVSGARRIVAIDPIQERLALAKEHGAHYTLAIDVKNARHQIEEITDGKMMDVVFDVTGHPSVLAPSIRLVRKLGRVVLLGDTPLPSQQCLGPGVVSDSIAILGIHGTMAPAQSSEFNPWTHSEMTALFFDLLLQGRMHVADLITDHHSPSEAPEIYSRLLQDRSASMGVIFDWSIL